MRLVLVSDTHGLHERIPPIPAGEVFVHAGDVTGRGTLPELARALQWLSTLPHRDKVLVAGNHDWLFARDPDVAEALCREHGVRYLRDAGAVIDGVRFWGAPWQPEFLRWAFNLPRGAPLAARWALIPPDTAVPVTHGPPAGTGDVVAGGGSVGDDDLRARVAELPHLQLHVFGHVHEGYGVTAPLDGAPGTIAVNASICTADYAPVNAPVVVDL